MIFLASLTPMAIASFVALTIPFATLVMLDLPLLFSDFTKLLCLPVILLTIVVNEVINYILLDKYGTFSIF